VQGAASIQAGARQILVEIGQPADLTLIAGSGSWGEELSLAGIRALLRDRIYRETDLEGLCAATGHTVLLGSGLGGGEDGLLHRALAIAAQRFVRVIVLPLSLELSDDGVREALAATTATVFAREAETYDRIRSLSDARLAHDCAFFFDYRPYLVTGSGIVNAFRADLERLADPAQTDREATAATTSSVERWLRTIAAHELVRTDDAHVAIAAAMLGKRVEFAVGDHGELPAVVRYSLPDFPVAASSDQRPDRGDRPVRGGGGRAEPSAPGARPPREPRVSAVVVVREHHHRAVLTDGELVLFLDHDAELEPGALERLVTELERHPGAAAVTATVLSGDGRVEHSGGWCAAGAGVAEFSLIAAGGPAEAVPPTGPADWMPGTAVLIRRSLLEELPLDPQPADRGSDLREWCYRVEQSRPGSFRRSREACAVRRPAAERPSRTGFAARSAAVDALAAYARFYERHGLLLTSGLDELVPELLDADGALDEPAARLLIELLLGRGGDWLLMEWTNGGLEPLLSRRALRAPESAEAAEAQAMVWLQERHQTLERIELGGWWQLHGRLLPAISAWQRIRARAGGS
jgi:hypothetical protein